MIILKDKRLAKVVFYIVSFSLSLAVLMLCLSTTASFAQTSDEQNQTKAVVTNNNSSANPVSGYQAYAIAKKHVYDAPSLDVHIYCSVGSGGIMASCLLFDGNSKNSSLIGIEYIISSKQYASLNDREKPNWTPVAGEAQSDLRFPNLTPQEIQGFFKSLEGAYTKLIVTWDPLDNLPFYPPQVIVESLIGHNETGHSEG
jgi:hypothetical protein